jgi:hypothetical protein
VKNHRPSQGTTTPTVWVRPIGNPAALGEGTYPSPAAADRTSSRVEAATPGRSRNARDTVATDTPALAATSVMLLIGAPPRSCL